VENLATLPASILPLWTAVQQALTNDRFKRAVFSKLAPDIAERFGISQARVPDMDRGYDVVLLRDYEDYRLPPHSDSLNKIVTMQFYLPEDDSMLDLGTSIFRRRGLFGALEEVKRFAFKPNSAYAFPISRSRKRISWHGRERISAFTGTRNTLLVNFALIVPPRNTVMTVVRRRLLGQRKLRSGGRES
jgi:hypothetical protein